jgi:hypothetical protein
MRVAGMMRLAEIDETKLGFDLIHFAIKEMCKYCESVYFLQMGNISQITLDFISTLGIDFTIFQTDVDYRSGWGFLNTESLDELYKKIPNKYDWIIYPDADDILPENLLEILDEDSDVIRLRFIECFNGINNIIIIGDDFPIGPHYKAVRQNDDITFIGSHGFNEPITTSGRNLIRKESDYCMRHTRYARKESIEARRNMNYFQDFFLIDHDVIEYKPNQKIEYYSR